MIGLSDFLGTGPTASFEGQTSGTAIPEGWLVDLLGGQMTATGIRVSPRDALTIPGVAACVHVMAEDIAKCPMILYRRLSGGGKERARDHALYKLIKERPARWLTSFALRRGLVHQAAVWGNGYARVRRDLNGQVSRITLIERGRASPRWTEEGEPFFDVTIGGAGIERDLSIQDVIHVPYKGSTDWAANGGIIGISPLAQHREAVALAIATERFGARFFANGARPSAVLETDKLFPNETVANRIRKGIERALSGLDNFWKIIPLEFGLKLKEWGSNNQENQLVEVRKHQALEFATMFRVPPHKIGIMDRATFSNIEHQAIEYVTDTLSSLAKMIEQQAMLSLLMDAEQDDYFIEINLDGLLRGDILSRYRAYAIGRNWGWLSADEVREFENFNPLPDGIGKTYLLPTNMDIARDDMLRDDAPAPQPRRAVLYGPDEQPIEATRR